MSATTKIEWCDATWNPIFWKGIGTATLPKSHWAYHDLGGRQIRQFPEPRS